MLTRQLRPIIEDRLRHAPAVALLGPRQVDKTTLARSIAGARKSSAMSTDVARAARAITSTLKTSAAS